MNGGMTPFILRVVIAGNSNDIAQVYGESKRPKADQTLAHVVACVNAHDELLAALRAAEYKLAAMSAINVGDKVTLDGIEWTLVTPDNIEAVRASIIAKGAP